MTLTESIRLALGNLAANKMRSLLTMLGMIIGVASVIAVMSIGRGTQASVTSQVTQMGTNLVFVRPGSQTQGGVRTQQGTAPTLTLEDANAIADSVPHVTFVAPENGSSGQVVAGSVNLGTRVTGVTEVYDVARNQPVEYGEFISEQNVQTRALVAVLGSSVAKNLFGDTDPIGQAIRINKVQFRVIGVLKSKGGTGFASQDDVIEVPLTTLQTRLLSQRQTRGEKVVSLINIQVDSEDNIDAVKAGITDVLRQRHRILVDDDFTVSSQEDTLAALNQIAGVFTIFLGSIAAISLVVGGIGIMNIMLVSVTERTREIGLRKALGARRRDILTQFLSEATVISVVGGGIGFALGFGISMLLPKLQFNGQPLNTVVSPDIALLAVCVSAATGLFFGIYPAMSAARLHPIDALRFE